MTTEQPAPAVRPGKPLISPWKLTDLMWGILAAALGVILLYTAAFLVALALGQPFPTSGIALILIGSIQELFILGSAALFSVVRYRVSWDTLGWRRFDAAMGCGLSAGLLAASYVIRSIYFAIAAAFGYQPALQDIITHLDTSGVGLVFSFVLVALIAPVAEETFFRGFLYGGLRRQIGVPLAMVLSTLFFTALHFTLGQFVPIFVLGLFLAWLYESTGSLFPGVLLHATNNGVSIIVLVLARIYHLPGF